MPEELGANRTLDSGTPESQLPPFERLIGQILEQAEGVGEPTSNEYVDRVTDGDARCPRVPDRNKHCKTVSDAPEVPRDMEFAHAKRIGIAEA